MTERLSDVAHDQLDGLSRRRGTAEFAPGLSRMDLALSKFVYVFDL
jgi:hypothetical protein